MKGFWLRRGLRFLAFGLLVAGLMGLAVMTLWNALLPDILGVTTITFGQALGLLVLSRILLGGFRGPGWGGGWRPRSRFSEDGGPFGKRGFGWKRQMAERWQQMTPEQRDAMKQQWRDRCGKGGRGRWNTPQPEQPAGNAPSTEADSNERH